MPPWLTLTGLGAKLAAFGAIVLAVLGFIAAVFRAGRKAERTDNLEKALDNAGERLDVDARAGALSDDAVRDGLRKQRDGWR